MCRLTAVGCVALLSLGLGGCGPKTAEANLKEQIAVAKEMMGDASGAGGIVMVDFDRIVKLTKRLEKLQKEFEKFPAAEQKAAKEKYAKELADVGLDDDDLDDPDDEDDMPKKSDRGKAGSQKADGGKADSKKADRGKAGSKKPDRSKAVPKEPDDE